MTNDRTRCVIYTIGAPPELPFPIPPTPPFPPQDDVNDPAIPDAEAGEATADPFADEVDFILLPGGI